MGEMLGEIGDKGAEKDEREGDGYSNSVKLSCNILVIQLFLLPLLYSLFKRRGVNKKTQRKSLNQSSMNRGSETT